MELDGAFEDVSVGAVVWKRGVGARDGEDVAKLGKEELVVGAFGGAGGFPAANEAGCEIRFGGAWQTDSLAGEGGIAIFFGSHELRYTFCIARLSQFSGRTALLSLNSGGMQ
jgi:hypothetical protein